ncbi:MAG: fructosamine kinase family protein [Neptuniibacter sp.]
MGSAVLQDKALLHWLDVHDKVVVSDVSASGGCIADSRKLYLNDGSCLFLKQMSVPVSGMFRAEAKGLDVLSRIGKIQTPKVLFQSDNCLVLEYIEAAAPVPDFDELLGQKLASMHNQTMDFFGFEIDTFCGATQQPNSQKVDGYQFYGEQRFLYLGTRCYEKNYIAKKELAGIESITTRLIELVPAQTPALLHGDLWRGNVHCDASGTPVLIDPAVYCGWAEADLAMTKLFGGFSAKFYAAYQEIHPLTPGWEQRMDLYNLWHLLNHLLLFGESYFHDVKQVIHKYA